MLPGTDGIELMEQVSGLAELPVIFTSEYGRDETIARALDAGAADYIVKPFSPTELAARVRATLRRHAGPERFVLRDLSIDYERRRVTLAGRAVELTATEYEVLRVLSANAGRTLTYHSLLRQAWLRYPDRPSPEIVRALVKRLRSKLGEKAGSPAYILNERQVGYRMPAVGERSRWPFAPVSCFPPRRLHDRPVFRRSVRCGVSPKHTEQSGAIRVWLSENPLLAKELEKACPDRYRTEYQEPQAA